MPSNSEKSRTNWYAVASFYAAYQTVRASLMTDPIFDVLPRLRGHNPNWIANDRGNNHHQARRGRGQTAPPAASDLLKTLYPQIAVEYTQLRSASIAVRYGIGLDGYHADDLVAAFHKIATVQLF